MLFNSISFAIFLPLAASAYFLLNRKYRKAVLLTASAIFYISFIPKFIFVLSILILFNYFAGYIISKSKSSRKLFFISAVTANVLLLALFKYFNFIVENISYLSSTSVPGIEILLPLGLSFHTFQAISYLTEVYRKNSKPERNLFDLSLYILFFPQLVAGPIERPKELLPQLKKLKGFDYFRTVYGLKLIAWGMFKKVVIADNLALFVNPVYNSPEGYSATTILAATFLFYFQIYCDFSGYIDIARGSAKIFGIDLVVNFNNPFAATSVRDFWKRWNTSLSKWFRDYIYIPLGGNRYSQLVTLRNVFVVFALTGIWHGASWNFVLWGLLHASLITFTDLIAKIKLKIDSHGHSPWSSLAHFALRAVYSSASPTAKSRGPRFFAIDFHRLKAGVSPSITSTVPKILVTFLLISGTWVFFRANSIQDTLFILKSFVSPARYSDFSPPVNSPNIAFLISLIFFLLLIEWKIGFENLIEKLKKTSFYIRWPVYYLLILSMLAFGAFTANKFIYFQF